MRIVVDLVHPADVNFYKNAIKLLIEKGEDVILVVRSRGILVSILEREIDLPINIIGKHYSSLFGKIFGAIKRDINLFYFFKKLDIDISTSFSPHPCRASRILGKPSIVFDDDYVYKLTFYLSKIFATRFVIPDSIPSYGKNIYKYHGFKELAYLHPQYYKSNKKILNKYELEKDKYIFVREIAGVSLDYKKSVMDLSKITKSLVKEGFKVILSLEDKSRKELFIDHCVILKEPIEDIYSLLKYSAFTISSGDTMAREASLLGTPSIYTGGRALPVDEDLIKNKCMFKVDELNNVEDIAKNIIKSNWKIKVQNIIKQKIENEWDDTTEIIINNLYACKK